MTIVLTRFRIHYTRGAELRYVGNLDMQLVWERTLRRARVPVAFSQGFNARPRFHMASALPLGFTSRSEILDLWLNEALDPQRVAEVLQIAAPPGLQIETVSVVALNLPALQTLVEASEYKAILRETPAGLDVGAAVLGLMAETTLPREWRKKPYDLRLLIYTLTFHADEASQYPWLEMTLSAREGATGRPEEVLSALGLDHTTARVERVRIYMKKIAAPLAMANPASAPSDDSGGLDEPEPIGVEDHREGQNDQDNQ